VSQTWLDASGHFINWLGASAESSAAIFDPSSVLRLRAAAWLIAYALGAATCWAVWQRGWRKNQRIYSTEQHYGVIQTLALMIGLLWGMGCSWLFQPESGTVTLGMVCLVGGLSGGVLSGIGVRARMYWLVCLPMTAGLMSALLYQGSPVNPVLPIALLVLLGSNGIFAHNIERKISSAIELRFENIALVEQLHQRTHAAEQANMAKSKFLAGASHDLRQPVHALNLFLESLSLTLLDAKQETIVTHAKAASRASRELLDTLLDFSRIEAGVMQPKPTCVPLAGLLRQLEDEFGPQADNKGLVYRSRDCFDAVHSDASLLLVILRNLVANAIRYTERGGVLLAVRSRGTDKVIEVWDTGIGIDPLHHEDIFQEFQQIANQERDHRKGLGLGLAIVRRLAQAMALELTLASRPGRGSVFSLRLPGVPRSVQLAEEAASAPPAAFELLADINTGGSPLQNLKVLLVDDEVLVLEGMRTLLGEWGCDVVVFKDIEGAVQYIQHVDETTPPFDLLITDYRLENGVTGGQVIHAVRAALEMRHPNCTLKPPSIILTGDTDPTRIAQAQSVGAILLHKPIETQVLHETITMLFSL
jgi:signal transduction histidine kinase/AmiR/NasT family two-component response regulator